MLYQLSYFPIRENGAYYTIMGFLTARGYFSCFIIADFRFKIAISLRYVSLSGRPDSIALAAPLAHREAERLAEQVLGGARIGVAELVGEDGDWPLAVAEELTPDAPLVLDDALVRFDDTRMAAALNILRKMAESKQVICFTCQNREAKA